MVRLLGIDLPKNKRIEYALTYIHGIGLTSAKKIVQLAEINPETRTNDITTEQSVVLRNILENFELKLEGDLRRFNGLNIKRLNEINCHRGKRHRNSLPVRGQRTRTNARSRRGSKKLLLVRKNNILLLAVLLIKNITLLWHKKLENQQ